MDSSYDLVVEGLKDSGHFMTVYTYRSLRANQYHQVETVRRELLSWYDDNRRMLPWRGDPPPWSK